jgi:hypothetical protein
MATPWRSPIYAYANSNPIGSEDATGLTPGDKFATPEEVAKDWMRTVYKMSTKDDF